MSRPWMALWIGDYLKDTGHLRTVDHGAYLLLIMHYWTTGGLPDDDAQLARVAKMTQNEWLAARSTIQAFFTDGWKHRRIEFELAKTAGISAAGKDGGKASGALRQKRYRDRKMASRVTPSVTPNERHFHQQIQDDRTSDAKLANGSPTERQPSPSLSQSYTKKDARYAARGSDNFDLKEAKKSSLVGGSVHVQIDTPQWAAWQAHLRKTTGKGSPQDKSFGWSFPSLWPPGHPGVP
jgi:uncharacterized protein YdaU (DUF1376 family)